MTQKNEKAALSGDSPNTAVPDCDHNTPNPTPSQVEAGEKLLAALKTGNEVSLFGPAGTGMTRAQTALTIIPMELVRGLK